MAWKQDNVEREAAMLIPVPEPHGGVNIMLVGQILNSILTSGDYHWDRVDHLPQRNHEPCNRAGKHARVYNRRLC